MPTLDQIQAERDAAIAKRSAIQDQQVQAGNAYTASAGRPQEFEQTFKDRMRTRFNQRAASRQQQKQAVGAAETAGANSLAATEGSGQSAYGRAQAATNATSFANQGILDAQDSVAFKTGNVTDVASSIVAGLEAQRAQKAAELEALNQQYAQANALVQDATSNYNTERAFQRSGAKAEQPNIPQLFKARQILELTKQKRDEQSTRQNAINGVLERLRGIPFLGNMFKNANVTLPSNVPSDSDLIAQAMQYANPQTQAYLSDLYDSTRPSETVDITQPQSFQDYIDLLRLQQDAAGSDYGF